MDAGKLNRLVTLQRLTLISNGKGGYTEQWANVGKIKVRAVPIAGKEGLAAGSLQESQPWRLDMRFRSDVTVKDQFKADWLPGKTLTIQSIADTGEPRPSMWQVVFATAVAA